MTEENKKPKATRGVKKTSAKKKVANTLVLQEEKIEKLEKEAKEAEKIPIVDLSTLLPENYFPKFSKFGLNGGYLTLPNRILRFVLDNPSNWYLTYDEYQYFGDTDFFLTLIYYIKEDGYVNVQNIQTNEFFRLNIEQNN